MILGETEGLYPADGSDSAGGGTSMGSGTLNVLTLSRIVRSNIAGGAGAGAAAGVPLMLTIDDKRKASSITQ